MRRTKGSKVQPLVKAAAVPCVQIWVFGRLLTFMTTVCPSTPLRPTYLSTFLPFWLPCTPLHTLIPPAAPNRPSTFSVSFERDTISHEALQKASVSLGRNQMGAADDSGGGWTKGQRWGVNRQVGELESTTAGWWNLVRWRELSGSSQGESRGWSWALHARQKCEVLAWHPEQGLLLLSSAVTWCFILPSPGNSGPNYSH